MMGAKDTTFSSLFVAEEVPGQDWDYRIQGWWKAVMIVPSTLSFLVCFLLESGAPTIPSHFVNYQDIVLQWQDYNAWGAIYIYINGSGKVNSERIQSNQVLFSDKDKAKSRGRSFASSLMLRGVKISFSLE